MKLRIALGIVTTMTACNPPNPHHAPDGLPTGAALAALAADGGPDFNRLVFEQSPYLLQHARNPVEWYPWGDAAFEKARRENKPIFLSVGYSTCHWCHVMEHESFENPGIAAILNQHFVAVKVDREERPDVDGVYMTYVQATTGGGGWPMSVWLTPDLKPFLGGTYFPPDDRWGRPGFASVLNQVAEAWTTNRDRIVTASDNVLRRLKEHVAGVAETAVLPTTLVAEAYAQLGSSYEPEFGGFGDAPKFPRPCAPMFMLRAHAHGADEALTMTAFTLRKMAEGGMFDQLGGGFHRYSVDARWHVPHFEKMLYDQGQLVNTYLEAYQCTHDPFFAAIAQRTLDYVSRDLTSPEGACYSAEDADSTVPENPTHKAEGAFYVWEQSEIDSALDKDAAAAFRFYYGVEPGGNVRSDPQGEFPRKNVLFVAHTLAETAQHLSRTPAETESLLAGARQTLMARRAARPRPHRDDKVITAWNGLMLSGFARASQVLGNPAYRESALRMAAFLRATHVDPTSRRLLRRSRAGAAGIEAYAEDYAFLIQGLLDLFEATADTAHLQWALDLQAQLDARFWDDARGGYFRTSGEDATVLLRMKEDYDGAEPAASSVAALNLLRLAQITGRDGLDARARQIFTAFSARLAQTAYAMPQMMIAYDFANTKPCQIVIAGSPDAPDTAALLREVHARFIPNKVLIVLDRGAGQAALAVLHPFLGTLHQLDGRATAYICESFACRLPTTEATKLAELLDGLTHGGSADVGAKNLDK